MGKFRKSGKKELPPVSTASLPDIVFMLLFFFMVSTTMKEVELKINIKVPQASQIKKLEKKSLVSYIYVGEPQKQFVRTMGTEPRIQLNDQFSEVSDIGSYIEEERGKLDEAERPLLTTSLKVDEKTKMGIVTDIKQQLRRVSALKINYSTRKSSKEE
ncbi:MAG TPA: biopolymer transporter ExbD [Marinilabiliales bacterium]|jgi:biopolymer transport protein ExbD|nr:MAG: biopolymer transporter ExbD [Bacteroidetes bacterium GWA2_40_14]OFX59948.1 MAG: biopolymer transporter ExbD [Bacteroidetes bacterium GWC2_40_13]OFX76261.1 MAG: biopolymer transporter ExbD [Bacteroidetes bacterium GWD2_40_43]OFX95766.1 MAG: biopolymer transporter ExbD [Bacteroidetes bacterium GWE2_40_63]OFY21729.1 MAG: biopolymer transporter ExbD [Bacteroidetes bacterium GWF2_40_13]OFZ23913.1 MAG: biopolymer transporter ExbD [Bacteroidetes bacterium RIFOXYC2_FULL_40_12]HAM98776.1 biopo